MSSDVIDVDVIPEVSRPLGLGEGAIFETHVYTTDLTQAMAFYGGALGLHLAHVVLERRIAFYWIGSHGTAMLGVWEVPAEQWRTSHFAFRIAADEIPSAARRLQAADIPMLDFFGNATQDPSVHAWMPACGIFFRDPDGNSLEFVAMLPDDGDLSQGAVPLSAWCEQHDRTCPLDES